MTRVNYRQYIVSAEWKRFRIRKLVSVNYRCERCKTRKAREIHHKHYNTLGHESLEDTEALCRPCHSANTKTVRLRNKPNVRVWPF